MSRSSSRPPTNPETRPRVLIADDERTLRRVLSEVLESRGFEVLAVPGEEELLAATQAFGPEVVVLDLRLGEADGVEVLGRLREVSGRRAPVTIMLTAHGTIRNAVEAMRRGAFDYLTKPVDNDELELAIRRAADFARLERRVEALETQVDDRFRPENMVGQSGAMEAVFRRVGRLARVDSTVLIEGETGTGKELVARALHRASRRREGPFEAVNCGAIPRTLLESTFFGHEKGAFTDAHERRPGAFERADGGTLFLDEVAELPQASQAGLLRVLQERVVQRVGGAETIAVDVRVVAATHRDLAAEVREGRFREDLFWRLQVVSIALPPLRDRLEDLPALADHFLARAAERFGIEPRPLAPGLLPLLLAYDWPGNVRELENVIEGALALVTGDAITLADLPLRLRGELDPTPDDVPDLALEPAVRRAQHAVERRLIIEALRRVDGHRERAAELLGVSRKTLFNKMMELGIES